MTETLILILMLFHPSGKYEKEMLPVTVNVCQTVDGKRVETSDCGMKACLLTGEKRAASHWSHLPGLNFAMMCRHPLTGEEVKKGTGAGGGHPGLRFEERN